MFAILQWPEKPGVRVGVAGLVLALGLASAAPVLAGPPAERECLNRKEREHILHVVLARPEGAPLHQGVVRRWTESPRLMVFGAEPAHLEAVGAVVAQINAAMAGSGVQIDWVPADVSDPGEILVFIGDEEFIADAPGMPWDWSQSADPPLLRHHVEARRGWLVSARASWSYDGKQRLTQAVVDIKTNRLGPRGELGAVAHELLHIVGLGENGVGTAASLLSGPGHRGTGVDLTRLDQFAVGLLYGDLSAGDGVRTVRYRLRADACERVSIAPTGTRHGR